MIEGVMAGLTSLLAVGCIYWSWRQRGQLIVAGTGWLLALGSIVIWSMLLGPEFGVTYAIIVFMCLTWLAVLVGSGSPGMDARSGESRARPYQALALPGRGELMKHGALFLMSVPITGILTLMLSVAAVLYLPWTLLNKIAVAIFLWPVIWGALSSWISAQQQLARPAMVLAGLLCISALALFI